LSSFSHAYKVTKEDDDITIIFFFTTKPQHNEQYSCSLSFFHTCKATKEEKDDNDTIIFFFATRPQHYDDK
jgi:hypothetical protein